MLKGDEGQKIVERHYNNGKKASIEK